MTLEHPRRRQMDIRNRIASGIGRFHHHFLIGQRYVWSISWRIGSAERTRLTELPM